VSRLRVAWPGWSTFRLEPERGPAVLIDPCFTPLLDERCARRADLRADLVLLTHPHHEHIRDAHRVARLSPAPFVAPPQVVEHLVGRLGMRRSRFVVIEPEQTVELLGLRVTARAFPHLAKHDLSGKLAILRANHEPASAARLLRFVPRLLASHLVIRRQPEHGPHLAYDLGFEPGPRVLFTSEGFTRLLPLEEAERWGRGARPVDLALVGVESGQEEEAARRAALLGARRVAAAAIHAPFERFYGRPTVAPERFLREGAAGWSMLAPGARRDLDL
jgi:hypothetical protein